MNDRQYALLRLLMFAEKPMTQFEISQDLSNFYPTAETKEKFHNTFARRMMTDDIRAINDSDFEGVIISARKGIRLATEQEFQRYINNQYASVFRRLQRVRRKQAKGLKNGQLKLDDNGEFEIVEPFGKELEHGNTL